MPSTRRSSASPASDAALISVHPKYVTQILDGSKRVEFRRVWASRPVTQLVLYSTAPDMRVVAILKLEQTVVGSATKMWELAKCHGGGLTRQVLREYFSGKDRGYGLIIQSVQLLPNWLSLDIALPGVRAPQSYAYLTEEQMSHLRAISGLKG